MSKKKNNSEAKQQGTKPEVVRASDADIQKAHDALLAEKEAPRMGFSPVPIFFIFLTSAVILAAAIYMVWSSDDFNVLGYDDTRRTFAWEVEETDRPEVDPLQAGQRIYIRDCAACHQAEGGGIPGTFPPLEGSEFVLEHDEALIRIVLHSINREEYAAAMPPFGDQLNDEQISHLLTYIRQAWGNDAEAISPDEVGAVRDEVGARAQPWSLDELGPYMD